MVLLLPPNLSWSVMHIHPGAYPHAAQDQLHHPSVNQIRAAGSFHAAMSAASHGTKNVAVIIVQFQASAAAGIISGSNVVGVPQLAAIDGYYVQQNNYFHEVSYGALTLNFTFFGVNGVKTTAAAAGAYTLPHPTEWYGCGDEGTGCAGAIPTPTSPTVTPNGDYLIRDALTVSDPLLTSTNYDAVVVMHAGNGNETTQGTPGDVWSIFYSQDPIIASAGRGFDEGDVVPATEDFSYSPLGVMCHEFGHTLGLPDLYNTTPNGGASVVGDWELMDSGPYDGQGANPAHMGAWDKIQLGWVAPSNVTSETDLNLGAVETSSDVVKLPVQNGSPGEYFLAEYRYINSGALFDRNIPGEGLLVWHIDDSIALSRGINVANPSLENTVNSGVPHYGVSIVSNAGPGISNQNHGSASDPFPNNSFFSNPKSDNFAGQPSGINLFNIAGVGSPALTSKAINLTIGASQNILKVSTYPNPAGNNYPHANGAGHTTFQIQVSRPAAGYSINIYTLGTNLVRRIGQEELAFKLLANKKLVYEYVWDLTNSDGSKVAPGVYFYTVRVDGESDRGKLVVIR